MRAVEILGISDGYKQILRVRHLGALHLRNSHVRSSIGDRLQGDKWV